MSRRRFRIGLHEIYDRRFDARKRGSQILNPMGNQVSWLVFEMGDEHGLRSVLAEWKGKLARAENAVAECDERFEQLKALRANTGRAVPTQRDHQAELEFMDSLAAADITGEEVDKLEAMLAKITATRLAAEASKVLRCGPCGTGKIGPGNVLVLLDGQTIKVNADGILVIDQPDSPYNGMLVSDYKTHLVRPWLSTHNRTCTIPRESLPPWPEGVPREKAVTK